MDSGVGDLVAALKRRGLWENTILVIIFTFYSNWDLCGRWTLVHVGPNTCGT